MAKGGEERRGAPRARCEVRVRVLSPKPTSGVCQDISQSGMRLALARPPLIPVGKELQVQFELKRGGPKITARAVVVRHTDKSAMGIRFLMLALEDVQAIDAWVAQGEPV